MMSYPILEALIVDLKNWEREQNNNWKSKQIHGLGINYVM